MIQTTSLCLFLSPLFLSCSLTPTPPSLPSLQNCFNSQVQMSIPNLFSLSLSFYPPSPSLSLSLPLSFTLSVCLSRYFYPFVLPPTLSILHVFLPLASFSASFHHSRMFLSFHAPFYLRLGKYVRDLEVKRDPILRLGKILEHAKGRGKRRSREEKRRPNFSARGRSERKKVVKVGRHEFSTHTIHPSSSLMNSLKSQGQVSNVLLFCSSSPPSIPPHFGIV